MAYAITMRFSHDASDREFGGLILNDETRVFDLRSVSVHFGSRPRDLK